MTSSPSEFIKNQINKPSEDSKKWRMAMIGLKGIAGFFIVGTILFIFKPALAATMTTMVQIAMTAWGGIVGIYLGAQGSVEFRSTAALENLNRNTQETREEHQTSDIHVIEQGSPGAPEVRPWSPVARE